MFRPVWDDPILTLHSQVLLRDEPVYSTIETTPSPTLHTTFIPNVCSIATHRKCVTSCSQHQS